jgi:hypothetical protein
MYYVLIVLSVGSIDLGLIATNTRLPEPSAGTQSPLVTEEVGAQPIQLTLRSADVLDKLRDVH